MSAEVQAKPKFPIMGEAYGVKRGFVPMEFMQRYEKQAIHNHSQSISRLAERGGLTPQEAMAVIQGQPWHDRRWRDDDAAWANCNYWFRLTLPFRDGTSTSLRLRSKSNK